MKICKPVVNKSLVQMNGLQRSAESFKYIILCFEHWISPDGKMREWMKINCRWSVWLILPAVLVMPVVGFILWQLAGWLSMLTGIMGKLVVLPILILLALVSFSVVLRTVVAFTKR